VFLGGRYGYGATECLGLRRMRRIRRVRHSSVVAFCGEITPPWLVRQMANGPISVGGWATG
jgi:hypothetical protein